MPVGVVRAAIALGAACLLGVGAFLALRSGEGGAASAPEEVVELRPNWLATHQAADGRWEAAGYDAWQMGERVPGNDPAGRGKAHNDVAVTALTVLALTRLGYGRNLAPAQLHPNDAAALWGRYFLRSVQREDGSFADPSRPFWATNHALATLALSEFAERFRDPLDAEAVQRAVRYRAIRASHRAWRHEQGPGDVPPIVWLALAKGPSYDPITGRDRGMVLSWVMYPEESWTVARIGAALAVDAQSEQRNPEMQVAAEWLAERVPRWDATGAGVDLAGWWLATEGLLAFGGEPWMRWEGALRAPVADTQRRDTDVCEQRGSWDPLGAWAGEGGRVFTTAMGALILGIYYRYDQVVGAPMEGAVASSRSSPLPPGAPSVPLDLPPRRYPPCR